MNDKTIETAALRMSNAAYLMSQAACALIEAMGMAATNQQREHRGESVAYNHTDFLNLLMRYSIEQNDATEILNRGL